jgi:hypothetical protein
MGKRTFTYGMLDARLRALGFTAHTQKGNARIYRHTQTGASVMLPDTPFADEVRPHHLVVARRVLNEHELGDLDAAQNNPTKAHDAYPPGSENVRLLVEDLVRAYKQEHPDEAEDLEVFPPRWYGAPEDGLLRIGRSIFLIRGNEVLRALREAEAPPAAWL